MTHTDRKALKKFLRRGDISKIAELAGTVPNNVSRWFNGDLENSVCEPYAIAFAENRKTEMAEKIKALNA